MPKTAKPPPDYDWHKRVDWQAVRDHLRVKYLEIQMAVPKFLKLRPDWDAFYGSPRADHNPFLIFLRFWRKPIGKPKRRQKTADNWPPRCASLEPSEIQQIATFVEELTNGGNFEKTFVIEKGMVDVELQIEDYHPFMRAPAP